MKRFGGLFDRVVAFDNLVAATRRASRGKARSTDVCRFARDIECEVLAIQRELLEGTYRPSPYTTFTVHDPKQRQITVAPFRDRVVHHAVCGVMEPYFERVFVHDSYACRRGKGTHRAIARAQRFARRSEFFLKLDVRSFFHSVDHGVLLDRLAERFVDARLLELVERIVRHPVPNCPSGRGLPIGNLTSPHFANFYLDALDHFVVTDLRPVGYVRYMDDLLVFADDKPTLHALRTRVREFLGDRLALELKEEATRLAPIRQGVPFLGRRIHPGLVRIRRENLRRSLRRWRRRRRSFARGGLGIDDLARSEGAIFAHLGQADSGRLRQGIVASTGGDQDGQWPGTGSNRVIRGGSWNNNAQNCRSANRNRNNPDNTNNNNGFRPVNSWQSQEVGVHGRRPGAPGHDQAHCPVPARAGRR